MQSGLSFEGRTVAVTGGCSGIGLALTKSLLRLGASVHVADIVDTLPTDLTIYQNLHFTGLCDITKRDACHAFIDSIPGRLDGLVNCAGIASPEGKLGTDELYRRTMEVNVTGTWNMGTEALEKMSAQTEDEHPGPYEGTARSVGQGSIVNVGSGASLRGVAGMAAYTASKHAVLGLTRAWAKDFPNLRVNLVAPGVTDTPLANAAHAENPDRIHEGIANDLIPRGRMAYPTDVSDCIVFLLSDWSSFMTGQVLPVNGGNL